ncbi:MAG: GAF domain-containing protein [Desulfobulbaceae bacterium]|nr:GAF domain-containing protein [Desulfobulbaceae bacterium]
MSQPRHATTNDRNEIKIRHSLILDIARAEYGVDFPILTNLLTDVSSLYRGEWPSHEPCQTGYHNLGHAFDVTLLTARMIAGWNRLKNDDHPLIEADLFLIAMASAMFHDAGYIKEKGDSSGTGGKYSFNHEDRSMALATCYLTRKGWPPRALTLAANIISTTKFHRPLDLTGLFESRQEEVIGRMMATADLVAQMADVNYMQRINDLYAELQEAYSFEGEANLTARGYKVFASANEMIASTVDFYENFVLPRLLKLGRMDQYLVSFFGGGRNPYLENIMANLSGQLLDKHSRWRRLGDILEDLGLVTKHQIDSALQIQRESRPHAPQEKPSALSLRDRLLSWMEGIKFDERCLGELLMDMKIINPTVLRQGLLQQIMPPSVVDEFSRDELLFFLEISVLLQNIGRGPWLFDQVLEMTNELLKCEASYILLANAESQEMLIAIPTGPNKEQFEGRIIPADKGLAGWVFSHGLPAMVSNVHQDERFDSEIDSRVREGFDTKSILAVPLHINGELIGVMELLNKQEGEFSNHDMDILTMLANLIAVYLDSAFRLQELYT